jgi:hypothetical protein
MEDNATPEIFPEPSDIGTSAADIGSAEEMLADADGLLAELASAFPECFNLDALHDLPDEDEFEKYERFLQVLEHVETGEGTDEDMNFINPAHLRLHIMRHLLEFGLCACTASDAMGQQWQEILDELRAMDFRVIVNSGRAMPDYAAIAASRSAATAQSKPASWNLFVEKDDDSVQRFVSGASKGVHTGELGGMFQMSGLMPANKY